KYTSFINNSYVFNFTINQCDSSDQYREIHRESPIFKSCYKPKCEPSCQNGGKCINDNICNCDGTLHKGQLCSDYYELGRLEKYDIAMTIISCNICIIYIFIL
ncbi:hypothetical protein PIROE2DRAFT_12271, partial [Piromyces sp. E2]